MSRPKCIFSKKGYPEFGYLVEALVNLPFSWLPDIV